VARDLVHPTDRTALDVGCGAAGLKPALQRRAVLTLLAGQPRPITAQTVDAELKRGGRHVGLTTVCRTLHSLADAGLLHVFDVNGEHAYRHCGPTTHQHLICDRCGQVAEYPSDMVARWLVQLHHHTGFTPYPDGLDLYGISPRFMARRTGDSPDDA
jgi:Fur family ferric uptake transcriptional regulator